MKHIGLGILFISVLVLSPMCCNASISSEADEVTITQLAEAFDLIFIANVTLKSIGTDHTYYGFHVIDYLTPSLNTTDLYLLVPGGSEIGISSSPTFYLRMEYVFFCDEITEDNRIMGNHYQYRLLDSVDVNKLENIVMRILAQRAASTNCIVVDTALKHNNSIEPQNPEYVKNTRGEPNILWEVVFLCLAGMCLVLLLVIRRRLV
ncbi:MAG: hypothetical protein NWF07_00460 [Candidatus Bathyarchaeota archaeon]|nr:hypothetical protein [Candidatus Bathyarchaeota archaeon]